MDELKQNNLEKDNNEILSIYNNLLKFALENYEADEEELKSYYNIQDKRCLMILESLIKLKEYNLLNFLDYSFIFFNCGDELIHKPIDSIFSYINGIIGKYEYDPENFIKNFFSDNASVIEIINDIFINPLVQSDYIDDNYKTVVDLFSDIFYKYSELINDGYYNDYDVDIYLNDYLNAIFYYLVINNCIKDDYNHVCDFLNDICDNIESTLDKIKLSGIKDDEDLFNYIDHAYKIDNTKQKIIK